MQLQQRLLQVLDGAVPLLDLGQRVDDAPAALGMRVGCDGGIGQVQVGVVSSGTWL